jgi:hypothetical protein
MADCGLYGWEIACIPILIVSFSVTPPPSPGDRCTSETFTALVWAYANLQLSGITYTGLLGRFAARARDQRFALET